jgi:GNAT superfamily N-acetyltransferase
MELIETVGIEVKDPEIRERDEKGRGRNTHHYLAMDDGKEVGLLSADFDNEWESEHFVIYELFVPKALRKGGYANHILQAAEEMAIERGYKKTLLVAKALDKDSFEQGALEAWYRRHGYEISYDFANLPFVKHLVDDDAV